MSGEVWEGEKGSGFERGVVGRGGDGWVGLGELMEGKIGGWVERGEGVGRIQYKQKQYN